MRISDGVQTFALPFFNTKFYRHTRACERGRNKGNRLLYSAMQAGLGDLLWPILKSPTTKSGRTTSGLSASIRSEEHTSELQSLMRNSYAVFCLKKKKHTN